ncbi:MAG: hypothetical protein KF819_20550 [Labilithrix sp.]|nr:hypothetical protein [Labilithrix sp.]
MDADASIPRFSASWRTGVGERFEIGMQAGILSPVGFDVKWNPVRGRTFDLAFMTRGSLSVSLGQRHEGTSEELNSTGVLGVVHLPVLLGLNAGPVTFVGSPGGAIAFDRRGTTAAVRAGLGIQIRLRRRFAVQPEVTWMSDVKGPTDLGFVTIGLAFQIRQAPGYGPSIETERK